MKIIPVIILADGIFHLVSSFETIRKMAPDWIIGDYLLDLAGFSLTTHRLIGIFLLITSLAILFLDVPAWFKQAYYWIIAPLTLGVIILAFFITWLPLVL